MKLDRYKVKVTSSFLNYDFYSIGPQGKIKKRIAFRLFNNTENVYNLGFGDVGAGGEINDLIVTNNADSQKVLATVAMSVFKFFEKYPTSFIFVIGSTETRTRLYRIAIANNLDEIKQNFDIFGSINNAWESFGINRNYQSFLLRVKVKIK